jgi:hypothetical protein
MKAITKEKNTKEGALNDKPKTFGLNDFHEIKPDFPLSEKDEVKAAEEKMRRNAKRKRLL